MAAGDGRRTYAACCLSRRRGAGRVGRGFGSAVGAPSASRHRGENKSNRFRSSRPRLSGNLSPQSSTRPLHARRRAGIRKSIRPATAGSAHGWRLASGRRFPRRKSSGPRTASEGRCESRRDAKEFRAALRVEDANAQGPRRGVGKQPAEPRRSRRRSILWPNRRKRVPITMSMCGFASSTRQKRLDIRQRRGQIGVPKADVVGARA